MNNPRRTRFGLRAIACALVFAIVWTHSTPAPAWGMLAPAQSRMTSAASGYDRAADVKTVQKALENKLVRQRLKDLGLNDREIESRVSRLSDEQVHQLATHIHSLSPAGDSLVIPGILVLVLVVLLIIYLVKRI